MGFHGIGSTDEEANESAFYSILLEGTNESINVFFHLVIILWSIALNRTSDIEWYSNGNIGPLNVCQQNAS